MGAPPHARALLPAVARELLGLLVVCAAAVATLAALVTGPWLHYLLYEGDSLALPLLVRDDVDPLHWVMTSQIFLFPELPLYLVSRIIGGSVEASLLVNAVLNVVLLYALLRALSAHVCPGRPGRAVGGAMVATLLFLLLVLTEGRALNNEGALATTFLLTTYYSGVVLAGLACIALVLTAARRRSARRIAPLVLVVLIGALTTLSNPLFVLVVVAPWFAAVALLALLRFVRLRAAVLLAAPVVASAAVGYASRGPFSRFVAVDASTYLHVERLRFAAGALRQQILTVAQTPAGVLELALLAVLLVAAPVIVLRARRARDASRGDVAAVLITVFAVVATLAMLAGQVATGSTVTRYLMPVAVFAVLPATALAALVRLPSSSVVLARGGAAVLAVASLVVAALALPPIAAASTATRQSASERCLTAWLGDRDLAGAGSFWTVRPLQLYGDPRIHVVQVNFDFSAQLWMSNTDDYESRPFTYVLADPEPDWGELAVRALGEPVAIIPCGDFDIYDYEGSPGAAELNRLVGESIDRAKEERGF